MKINDSLFNENIRKMALTKQIAFDFQLKENKILAEQEKKDILAKQDKKEQLIVRNILITAFILLLVIAGYIYYNYRDKKRINELISEQKEKLELQHIDLTEKQKEILDSIEYAKRLQRAILAPEKKLQELFFEAFIIYQPKSIVSGDFYWFAESSYNKIIAVADCTGHGVPGGFMSMLGYEMLQDVLLKEQITTTSMALKVLDQKMTDALSKSGSAYRDGMDIALCAFGKNNSTLQFSGANRPLIKISDGKITEIKPNKFTIGGDIDGTQKSYDNHEIPFEKGDVFYLFSDGYSDQFGGDKNKKFSYRKLKELLLEISQKPITTQKDILLTTFEKWKALNEQIDDVCVIGIKI
jgi:serine phosphatase RsbU (regulator of sigma subunit)